MARSRVRVAPAGAHNRRRGRRSLLVCAAGARGNLPTAPHCFAGARTHGRHSASKRTRSAFGVYLSRDNKSCGSPPGMRAAAAPRPQCAAPGAASLRRRPAVQQPPMAAAPGAAPPGAEHSAPYDLRRFVHHSQQARAVLSPVRVVHAHLLCVGLASHTRNVSWLTGAGSASDAATAARIKHGCGLAITTDKREFTLPLAASSGSSIGRCLSSGICQVPCGGSPA